MEMIGAVVLVYRASMVQDIVTRKMVGAVVVKKVRKVRKKVRKVRKVREVRKVRKVDRLQVMYVNEEDAWSK